MNVEYERNLNHNYIKIMSENTFFEYQVQMITRNEIAGLLECVVERIDNNVYFLYEINSKQPFVQVFERKKINIETLKALLLCLKNAVENVGDYLLDVNSILLEPEFIYMNPETKDVKLIYIPGVWNDIKEKFRELSRQLLDWIDYKDEQAVAMAYELNHRTGEENYSLDEILDNLLQNDCEEAEETNMVQEKVIFAGTDSKIENTNMKSAKNKTRGFETWHDDEDLYGEEEKTSLIKRFTIPFREAAENLLKGLNFRNKNEENEEEYYEDYDNIVEKTIKYEDYTKADYSMAAEEGSYGNTIFFQTAVEKKKRLTPVYDDKYSVFELNIFPFIIGKLAEAVDGVIDDESVSRIHAKIEKNEGQFYLVDLNSTNGTYLNGKIIAPNEKTKLQAGDRVQFGFVEFKFENN